MREVDDTGGRDVRLAWDPNIRLTSVTDAAGGVTDHYYDELGYTYRIAHPDGGEEWFDRDADRNVTRHLRPDGSEESFAYDVMGRLWEARGADAHLRWAYDALGRVIEERQALSIFSAEDGRVGRDWLWRHDYDELGNRLRTRRPDGLELATFERDGEQQIGSSSVMAIPFLPAAQKNTAHPQGNRRKRHVPWYSLAVLNGGYEEQQNAESKPSSAPSVIGATASAHAIAMGHFGAAKSAIQ